MPDIKNPVVPVIAVVGGGTIGYGTVAATGMTAAGMVGGGAGVGAAAGPVGVVIGGLAGLAIYGVARVFNDWAEVAAYYEALNTSEEVHVSGGSADDDYAALSDFSKLTWMDCLSARERAGEEVRPEVPWEEPFQMNEPHRCGVWNCDNIGPGFYVTKHRWGNRPLGQFFTRCPTHQEQYVYSGPSRRREEAEAF